MILYENRVGATYLSDTYKLFGPIPSPTDSSVDR